MKGMVTNIFLTNEQLDKISNWKYKAIDNDICSKLFDPLYNKVSCMIPRNVSANILSFSGLILSSYAYYLTTFGLNSYNFFSGIFIFLYMFLDAVDGKHARNTNTSSSLGELIDHFCDCITNVILTVAICNVYELTDEKIRWCLVAATQILFFKEHFVPFYKEDKVVVFGKFNGPTTIICLAILLIWLKPYIFHLLSNNIIVCVGIVASFYVTYELIELVIYISQNYSKNKDFSTTFGIGVCMLAQIIKFIVQYNFNNYMDNGIILGVLTADIIIGKMACRELHQLVPVLHMITCIFPKLSIWIALCYFIINVFDISSYTHVPIINPQVNVFVCGYYDGLHDGHIESLRKASYLGTNLLVGVHSQSELLKKLEKKNIMPIERNEVQRYTKVKNCKYVTRIIEKCSPYELTADFIKENKIHVVGMSDEYIIREECGKIIEVLPYYQPALEMGILRIISRTNGISSSELRF